MKDLRIVKSVLICGCLFVTSILANAEEPVEKVSVAAENTSVAAEKASIDTENTSVVVAEKITETAEDAAKEQKNYAYGTVAVISGDSLTLKEVTYDEETWEEKVEEVAYKIAPDVEVDNVESIQKVKAGDKIDVEYIEKNGNKDIKYIYVYEEEEIQ
ncbi:secreted protein [Candidatus Omnitrophus magneticus]|uniref:Secreted protein n=1 Tax=Candidatus Omnitrophus magneticus TaxID=1609969 RepID=A0A0F0CU23_9BACT|nr:secreted protein [Candidatus Omnitrophus magneticus]KJJ85041.1 secreted protein [Candidatus Omnitrophus magneticus]